jgi:hypothetical protein
MDQDMTTVTAPRGIASRADWALGRAAGLAAATGLVAFLVGAAAESLIIRAVHGDRRQLEWLSDAVISLAVAGISYLWLHLRASRQCLLSLEQAQIAIDEQLRLAAEIQRSLLPDVPQATPGFRWAARMIPAGRIGGDFYDFVQPAPGIVLAILGDVSGKGIPAALILSSLKTRDRRPGGHCHAHLRRALRRARGAALRDGHRSALRDVARAARLRQRRPSRGLSAARRNGERRARARGPTEPGR